MPTVKDKNTGKVISRQPYNNQGTQTAASIANSNPNWEASYDTNDARSRSQVNQAGSGKTGYSNIGVQGDSTWYGAPKVKDIMQPVDEYSEGGKTTKEKRKNYQDKLKDIQSDFETAKGDIKEQKAEATKERAGELTDFRSKASAIRRDRSLSSGERTRRLRALQEENKKKGLAARDKRKQRRKLRRKARKNKKMKAIQAKVDSGVGVWEAEKSKLKKHKEKDKKK